MKKCVLCFLTVIMILLSSISFAFAFDVPDGFKPLDYFVNLDSKKTEKVNTILSQPYLVYAKEIDKKTGKECYSLYGFDFEPEMNSTGGFYFKDDGSHNYCYFTFGGASSFYVYDMNSMEYSSGLNPNAYNIEVITNFTIAVNGVLVDNIILHNGSLNEPVYDLENDWLSQTTEEGIYIIAPKSGKAFTLKDPAVNITVQYRYGDPLGKTGYQHLYASTDGTTFSKVADNDTSLSPFSGVMLSQDEKIVEHDGKPYKEGTLTYKLNVRKNIQLTLYAAMEKTDIVGLDLKTETFQSNSINLTWYDDFIDKDGDGNDDRDNDPDYHPSQDDQANNTDVSKFESITDVLNSLKGTLSGFISFITNFFKFIPSDIFILIGVGITIIILLRIFGR